MTAGRAIAFWKMAGAGNDFILVDNRSGTLDSDLAHAARRLSDRKHSIGADGLILLESSQAADIRMRIFNPDGSEAQMCGNGVRCLAKFSVDNRITKNPLKIETIAGVIGAEVKNNGLVRAKMGDPTGLRLGFNLEVLGKRMDLNFINTGVPHAVLLTDSLEDIDVFTLGRAIRRHSSFAPEGTNANFISVRHDNSLHIRTYERGVEDETLSCGTGATAAALVAASLKGFESPVVVTPKSGESLKVYFSREGENYHEVYLEGPVEKTFEGRVTL